MTTSLLRRYSQNVILSAGKRELQGKFISVANVIILPAEITLMDCGDRFLIADQGSV